VSILDEIEGTFLGGVMVLEVMRDGGRAWGARLGDSFLKHPERRLPIKVGDSELGLFLHPQARGQGIALQAAYVLLDRLSSQREPESKPIVRRVWAETGANNGPAQGLLRKMGFIERPEFAVPPALSLRYERDGTPIGLVHFNQPDSDEQTDPGAPIRVRLRGLVERNAVCPN